MTFKYVTDGKLNTQFSPYSSGGLHREQRITTKV
jgi:hypothetical protein